MKAWYLSHKRFEKRIIKRWGSNGFKFNAGHIQLLKYSYQTLMFWSIKKRKPISQRNKPAAHPKQPTLF